MSKTIDKNKRHDALITKYEANERVFGASAFDALAENIRLTLEWYALALALMTDVGMSVAERTTMRGGTFYGMVTGKKVTPLSYSGARTYPSSTFCSRAFGLKYLHTAGRFAEYKRTNTSPDKQVYYTWLQVMYGDSTGEHASLQRNPEGTIARFDTVPPTKADTAAGRKFASATLKAAVRDDNAPRIPSAISKVQAELIKLSPTKLRNESEKFDTSSYEMTDLLALIRSATADYMIRDKADKAAKAAAKKAKASA